MNYRKGYDKSVDFPSQVTCPSCGGAGGGHDGSRDHGHRTPWGDIDCYSCNNQGEWRSGAKVIRRYTIPATRPNLLGAA
jgi:DnaJ-class molecular chaperone